MDQWKTNNETSESVVADAGPSTSNSPLQNTNPDQRFVKFIQLGDSICFILLFFNFLNDEFDRQKQKQEMEVKDPRKIQKADREKLRRDRLNEQFLELGNTLGI